MQMEYSENTVAQNNADETGYGSEWQIINFASISYSETSYIHGSYNSVSYSHGQNSFPNPNSSLMGIGGRPVFTLYYS